MSVTLMIPDVPDELARRLRARAAGNRRTLQAELLDIVETAVREGPEAFAILLLMMDTDLRVSEVCALRWSDVDLKAGVITIRPSISTTYS